MRPCFSTSWATYTTHEYITPSLQPKILCIYTCIYIYTVYIYIYTTQIEGIAITYIIIYILYIYTYTHTCTSILHKYSASLSPQPVNSVTPVHQATCRSMAHKLSERAPAIQVRLRGLWWPYQQLGEVPRCHGRASAFLVWKMLEKSMENWRISLQDGYQQEKYEIRNF